MTSNLRASIAIAAAAVLAAAAMAVGSSVAAGAPATAKAPAPPVRASLETSASSLPASGTVGLTAALRASRPLPAVRVRFRIYSPAGHLLVQKTFTPSVPKGRSRVSLSYDLDQLGLTPGAYPAVVTVRVLGSSSPPIVLDKTLYLYGKRTPAVPVVLVARVSGQPMRDPAGHFVIDPAVDTSALDDAVAAANLATGNASFRLALAVPPLLLEEWRRVSLGYDLVTPAGVVHVAATDPTPLHYGAGLDAITAASRTGHLELLAVGYTDPDPSSLARVGLLSDLVPQFRSGLSATFASLGTSPSTGAMFAGGCLPAAGVPMMTARGIRYAVLSGTCVRSNGATVETGAYPVTAASKFTALLADRASSAKLSSGEASPLVAGVFERAIDGSKLPFVASAEMGPGREGLAGITAALTQLAKEPWARFATPSEALPRTAKRKVQLLDRDGPDRAPAYYWAEVVGARKAAQALISAAGASDSDAQLAWFDSLVAESSSWAGPDRAWLFAERGRSFAAAATRASDLVLGAVTINAADLTLSGARGEVPVTVHNGTKKTLQVEIRALGGNGNAKLPPAQDVTLRPSDNFFTLPVDLRSSVSARLLLVVEAGGTEIARDTVTIRASYLDRLAIVGGIVAVLAGLLAFIVIRVRRAEASGPEARADGSEARYTVDEGGEGAGRRTRAQDHSEDRDSGGDPRDPSE